jgi:hypothetical protein
MKPLTTHALAFLAGAFTAFAVLWLIAARTFGYWMNHRGPYPRHLGKL